MNPHTVPSITSVIIGGIIGSILPDFDLRIKHRMIMHNLLTLLTASTIIYMLLYMTRILSSYALFVSVSFALAFSSHILLDMFTKAGVAILYPFSNKRFRVLKLKSSSPLANALFTTIGLILMVYWAYNNSLVYFRPLWLQQP